MKKPIKRIDTRIETTARAEFFFGEGIESRRVLIEKYGNSPVNVSVWDDLLGQFTRYHHLSRRSELRIARQAAITEGKS